ncbi:MAG: DUF2079 domain-containing protein [Candidatus Buchananbacteria bacterium]|nr:DUF2079 domain-containing protein [Candidatus Buchananbacteria bacterium]
MKPSVIQSWITTHNRQILFAAIALYSGLFSLIAIWKYHNFYYTAIDLAIFNQTFFNSLLGNWFGLTIHPPSYLGDHFSPLLILLLPFYALTKNPESLLILLATINGLSAWPLYLIAKKALGAKLALPVALAWLLNPVVQNTTLFEFNFLSFAVFFLFWAFYSYQRKKFLPAVLFLLLAMLAREDVSLVVLMFGIVALGQKKSWRWVVTPLIMGLVYFSAAVFVIKVFAPADEYKFFIYYPWINHLTTQPWLPIIYLLRPNNIIYLIGLGLTVVFLPLISPLFLLLGAIIALQLLLGGSGGGQLLLETHYSSLLLPALFIASIYGLKKIFDPNQKPTIIKLVNQHRALLTTLLVFGVFYASVTLGPASGIWQHRHRTDNSKARATMLRQIPDDQAVASSYQFLPTLSSRKNIYSFNYAFLGKQQFLRSDYKLPEDTTWIALDFSDLITYQIQYGFNPYYQNQYQAALKTWPKLLDDFGLVAITDSYALYQRNATAAFELVKILDTPPINANAVSLTNGVIFLGYQKEAGQYQLLWQLMLPQEIPYRIRLELIKDGKTVYQKLYPFGYDLLLNAPAGPANVQTNYWFNPDHRVAPGTYDLKLTLVKIIDGGIEVDEIRSTKNVIDQEEIIGEILKTKFIVPLDTL